MKAFLLCILFVNTTLFAAAEIATAQARATGDSLTGALQLNESLYSNPASSAFARTYSVEGSYYGSSTFSASVLDTRTSKVGGSIGYFRKEVPFSEDSFQGAKLGLVGKMSPRIGVGIVGKILWGPTGPKSESNLKDADGGVLVNLGSLKLGGLVRNLFGGDESLGANREWGIGGQFGFKKVLFLSAASLSDWKDPGPYQFGVGVEYVYQQKYAFKAGYRLLTKAGDSFWGLGASILGPKMMVHYSMEIPNDAGYETEHVLSLVMMM